LKYSSYILTLTFALILPTYIANATSTKYACQNDRMCIDTRPCSAVSNPEKEFCKSDSICKNDTAKFTLSLSDEEETATLIIFGQPNVYSIAYSLDQSEYTTTNRKSYLLVPEQYDPENFRGQEVRFFSVGNIVYEEFETPQLRFVFTDLRPEVEGNRSYYGSCKPVE